MNGPQHYREAEKYLSAIHEGDDFENVQSIAQIAQVHATLALAAATVDAAELHTVEINGTESATEWGKAVQ